MSWGMLYELDLASMRRRLQRRRNEIMARYQAGAEDLSWVRLLSDADANRLLRIFEALRRIDQGTFGLCVACGATIEPERLRAEPEAHQCEVCVTFVKAAAAM